MKTNKAFLEHLNECRKIANFSGILVCREIHHLNQKYYDLSVKDFKEYAVQFMKRKKEED